MDEKQTYISEIYSATVNEINRYRDWPIRVLAFTSVLHWGIIGAFLFKDIELNVNEAKFLIIFLIVLGVWTIFYFYKCHIHYLEARKAQSRLQRYMKLNELTIDKTSVLPRKWFEDFEVSGYTNFWGWGFYFFYSIAMTICACWVILRTIAT